MAPTVILFEDDAVERLHPITIGRPAYAVSCGAYSLIQLLETEGIPVCGIVRPHLAEVQRLDYPQLDDPTQAEGQRVLLNARVVPSQGNLRALRDWWMAGQTGVVRQDEAIVAALLPPGTPAPVQQLVTSDLPNYYKYAGVDSLPKIDVSLTLFEYPHDVVRHNIEILPDNLAHRIARGQLTEQADGVFLGKGAQLGEHCVVDTSDGPIIIDRDAQIGPFVFLQGPAYIGPRSRVIEHAAIKDAVSIGHTTKIGGEIEASVIEPYTNKQHYGFLGHSYLGSWINLGAGTCNSDLKNTYGTVNMDYQGQRVATGMQFVGCIIGDYSKSAINTGIFTGKVIGACSMVYGFVTTNVPSFVNYARLFGQVTELPADVMTATQHRMFVRRKVEQRPCDIQLIHDMYELSRNERQLAGEPLSL
jgi:UDP-N-acetylglucosamine diphosphorylase/glucosamine-1-phosphate N-acetyltransferase